MYLFDLYSNIITSFLPLYYNITNVTVETSNKEELFVYYAPLVMFYTPVVTKYAISVAEPAFTTANEPS